MPRKETTAARRIRRDAWVALKSDPTSRGQVLEVRRNGTTAWVQFVDFDRPTLHAVGGLILISDSAQMLLFR